MSGQYQISLSVNLSNPSSAPTTGGQFKFAFQYSGQPTQTDLGISEKIITATGTTKIIDFGEVTVPSLCIVQNLDDTNTVEVGPMQAGTADPEQRLPPGAATLLWLRPTDVQIGVTANGADCEVYYAVLQA